MKFNKVLEDLKHLGTRAKLPEWSTRYWFWFPHFEAVVEIKDEKEMQLLNPWNEFTMAELLREDWDVFKCYMEGPSVFGFDIASGLMEKGYRVRRANWEEGVFLKIGLRSKDLRESYILFVDGRQEGFLMRPDDVQAKDWMMFPE